MFWIGTRDRHCPRTFWKRYMFVNVIVLLSSVCFPFHMSGSSSLNKDQTSFLRWHHPSVLKNRDCGFKCGSSLPPSELVCVTMQFWYQCVVTLFSDYESITTQVLLWYQCDTQWFYTHLQASSTDITSSRRTLSFDLMNCDLPQDVGLATWRFFSHWLQMAAMSCVQLFQQWTLCQGCGREWTSYKWHFAHTNNYSSDWYVCKALFHLNGTCISSHDFSIWPPKKIVSFPLHHFSSQNLHWLIHVTSCLSIPCFLCFSPIISSNFLNSMQNIPIVHWLYLVSMALFKPTSWKNKQLMLIVIQCGEQSDIGASSISLQNVKVQGF